jgi:hypothetical protein
MKRIGKIAAYGLAAISMTLLLFAWGCNNDYKKDGTEGPDSMRDGRSSIDDRNVIKDALYTEKAAKLKMEMRKLWDDHVWWTREVVICIVDNVPGGTEATERLMQNQEDIGDAFKPYYGKDAGNELTGLLKPHITIAAEVVKAAKANNKSALENANERWYANADSISDFLGKANPDNWGNDGMKKHMRHHLDLLTDQVTSRIKKDYKANIKALEKSEDQILEMADMLSEGVIKQFPDKFKDAQYAKSERVY